LVTLASGCLFTPRESEPPEQGELVPWDPPTAPEKVLGNIKTTLEATYAENYKRSFATGPIIMEMDPGEYADAGVTSNPFEDWTRDLETQRMTSVFTSMDDQTSLAVEWDPDALDKWRESEGFFDDISYRLTFERGVTTVVYEGRVDLYLEIDNSLYAIRQWRDKLPALGDNQTWCFLRHVREWNP
jgi:hypothetical protein